MPEQTYTVTLPQLQTLAKLGNRVQDIAQVVQEIDEEVGALIAEIAGVEGMATDQQRDAFYEALLATEPVR